MFRYLLEFCYLYLIRFHLVFVCIIMIYVICNDNNYHVWCVLVSSKPDCGLYTDYYYDTNVSTAAKCGNSVIFSGKE